MPKFITPVDVTPTYSTDATWESVDVTTHLGGDAGSVAGVILHIHNTGPSTSYEVGVAHGDASTILDTGELEDEAHCCTAIGINAAEEFQFYIQTSAAATALTCWLIGYVMDTEGAFFTESKKRTGTSGTFTDWDISTDTGADTAICVFGQFIETTGSNANSLAARNNGSTQDVHGTLYANDYQGFMIGCDGSEIFELRSGSNIQEYVHGYLTDNFTAVDFEDNSTATTGSYQTVDVSGTVGAAGVAAMWYMNNSDDGEWSAWVDANGGSFDQYGDNQSDISEFAFLVSQLDGSQVARQRIQNVATDLFLIGWFEEPSGSPTPQIMHHHLRHNTGN